MNDDYSIDYYLPAQSGGGGDYHVSTENRLSKLEKRHAELKEDYDKMVKSHIKLVRDHDRLRERFTLTGQQLASQISSTDWHLSSKIASSEDRIRGLSFGVGVLWFLVLALTVIEIVGMVR